MTKQIDLKALLASKTEGMTPAPNAAQTIERAERAIPKNLMFSAESTEFIPETKPSNSIATRLTVEEAKSIDDEMNRFIDTVLISDVDYGVIPNCRKPTLLKSGAEKIMNYLGLVARVEITNRVEDYNTAFFSYEVKVYLIDRDGAVRGEGVGITNTRENKYAKSNGYSVQNVVLKMAKKRALVDAVLNVGSLSARFTQDVEDMNITSESNNNNTVPATSQTMPQTEHPASDKQLAYIERLMSDINTTPEKVNAYLQKNFGVNDYRNISGNIASKLIGALLSGKQR